LHEAPSRAAGDTQSQRESAGRARLEQAAPAAKSVQGQDAELAAEADPQRWIERIRALRAAGKLQEAEESLREFRKRYPDFRLPPDLEPAR
jgi:TolA-binding protein